MKISSIFKASVLLLAAAPAFAADLTLRWTGHANATHYRIYQSVDSGATWQQAGADIPQPNPFPANAEISGMVQNVPETGLVLFRASALRDTDEKVTHEKGAWYNHTWTPPAASSLGLE